ncbi:MAG: outer membrane lipoprotein-sorting protein [Polaribacter sp.]|jgi:outer membrane lipoprotein-sorting protein
MKKILVTLICLISFTLTKAQSDKAIASVYIKRAYEAIETNVNYEFAQTYFEKAMKYTDSILDRRIAALGSRIYFEVHHKQPTEKVQLEFLEKAKGYSMQYFNLATSTKSEEYIQNTEHFIMIEETLEILKNQIKENEIERLRKEKELRKIDSLKTLWLNKSESLSIKVDSIYKFNKNNVALYNNNNFIGLINDLGEVLLEAKEYVDALSFDGYVIFKNKIDEPTKLYSFNTNNNTGFHIPSISDFNSLSTHYGKVMLPRGNGRLVTYPDNSYEPMVYDLNLNQIVKISNKKELFKNLKKADVIDKYNKDDEIKIGKTWYNFGGHLGGGVHPLYTVKGYDLEGFLCSVDGKLLRTASDYQFIGAFYNNKFQALKGAQIFWVNQNGTKVSAAKDEAEKYTGNSKLTKLENGAYQIMKDDMIVLRDEKLEKLVDYLTKRAKQE